MKPGDLVSIIWPISTDKPPAVGIVIEVKSPWGQRNSLSSDRVLVRWSDPYRGTQFHESAHLEVVNEV